MKNGIIILALCVSIISCKRSGYSSNIGFFETNDTSIALINDTVQIKYKTYWLPNELHLYLIDSIIKIAIRDTIDITNKSFIIRDIKKFYRQYACYLDKNNDSIVYINAFCKILNEHIDSAGIYKIKKFDWKHKWIFMEDGGSCYWQIKINITKKEYFDFRVNGVS